MSSRVILVGSNDLGLVDLPWLRAEGARTAEAHAGYSGSSLLRMERESLQVEAGPLETIHDRIRSRLTERKRIDAVCLMSCSPYGGESRWQECVDRVRDLPEDLEPFPSVPARVLPIVISDLRHTLAGRTVDPPRTRWLRMVGPSKSAVTDSATLARSLSDLPDRTWRTTLDLAREWTCDLTLDLEVGGLLVSRSPEGDLVPRVALRRKALGGTMHRAGFDPRVSRAAGLPIFAADVDVDEEPFTALHELLNRDTYRRYAAMDRTQTEVLLHRFLEENLAFLTKRTLETLLSEKLFRIRNGERSGMRPDLILRPMDRTWARPTLVEMKLPSAAVYRRSPEVERFTRGLLRAVQQVREYRRRLLDPSNEREVRRVLGTRVPEFDLAVWIGMRPADEPEGYIDRLREVHGLLDVRILRYNEIATHRLRLSGPDGPAAVV